MWSCLLPDLNLGVTVPVAAVISHLPVHLSLQSPRCIWHMDACSHDDHTTPCSSIKYKRYWVALLQIQYCSLKGSPPTLFTRPSVVPNPYAVIYSHSHAYVMNRSLHFWLLVCASYKAIISSQAVRITFMVFFALLELNRNDKLSEKSWSFINAPFLFHKKNDSLHVWNNKSHDRIFPLKV